MFENNSQSQLSIFKVTPNPGLVAETSLAQELGATLLIPSWGAASAAQLDFAVFKTDYENMIEPVIWHGDTIRFTNITASSVTGLEFSLQTGLINNLILAELAYAWINPIELNSGGDIGDLFRAFGVRPY